MPKMAAALLLLFNPKIPKIMPVKDIKNNKTWMNNHEIGRVAKLKVWFLFDSSMFNIDTKKDVLRLIIE